MPGRGKSGVDVGLLRSGDFEDVRKGNGRKSWKGRLTALDDSVRCDTAAVVAFGRNEKIWVGKGKPRRRGVWKTLMVHGNLGYANW